MSSLGGKSSDPDLSLLNYRRAMMKPEDHAPASAKASLPQANGILMEMTISDVREFRGEVAVLPLTSVEPHGPHLPYGTDYFIGDGIVRQAVLLANKRQARVLLYPSMPYGNNVNFKAFPTACRVRVRTYMHMLLDIIEALEEDGFRKIVLVNSHGGNIDTIKAVLREHFERHPAGSDRRAFVSFCAASSLASPEAKKIIEHASDHAGESETSLIMHFQGHLVRTSHLGDFPMNKPELAELKEGKVQFVRPWEQYMPVSCGGNSSLASADKGKTLADSAAAGLADYLVRLSGSEWHPGFPYKKAP